MIELDNENCWNTSLDKIAQYCPIKDYIDVKQSFDIYFVPWQTHYTKNKVVWKIYMMEDLL